MIKGIVAFMLLSGLVSCIVKTEDSNVPDISNEEIAALAIESRLSIVADNSINPDDTLPKTTVYPYEKLANGKSQSMQLRVRIANFPRKRKASVRYKQRYFLNDSLVDSSQHVGIVINTCCGENHTGRTGVSIPAGPNPYFHIGIHKYFIETYLQEVLISNDTLVFDLPRLVSS